MEMTIKGITVSLEVLRNLNAKAIETKQFFSSLVENYVIEQIKAKQCVKRH